MKLLVRALCIITPLGLLTTSAVVGQRRYESAGRGAFLGFQVDSTEELVAVLKQNPGLRRRYARHFGLKESEVVDFVRRALVVHRLPKARTVTNYGVTRSGRVFSTRTRLRAGTKVWATRSGVPILKWACANPLTRMLPGERLASTPRQSGQPPTTGGRLASLPLRAIEGIPVEGDLLPLVPLEVASAPGGGGLSGAGALFTPGLSGAALPVIASSGGGLGFLAPLAFLPLITGGGGGGETPTPPIIPIVPAVIPEPGTFALLALGLPILGIAHRRRR